MRCLISDDTLTARTLLKTYLSPVADCDFAEDGKETVDAVRKSIEEKNPYDMICLDIMMPNMDGQEALKRIRQIEKENGIHGLDGVKVIMTTALGNSDNVMEAFREGCEAYLVKPLNKVKLFEEMEKLGVKLDVPA
jgi:two-component system chemotaxis response regulator CheY